MSVITRESEAKDERARRLTKKGFATGAAERKAQPVASGFLDYFPLACLEVAKVSQAGNDQHNPGEPLHWARGKSTDEADALLRHFMQRGTRDSVGLRHSAQVAWRALALLQKEIEDDIERQSSAPSPSDSRKAAVYKVAIDFEPGQHAPDTWKPVVIIESPYAGNTKRNMLFLKYCERDCLRSGFVPIASHRLFTEALDDTKPADRELGISAGYELYRLADRQRVYYELGTTPGMREGIMSWRSIHKHCRPSEFANLPPDLRLAFERECAETGARL